MKLQFNKNMKFVYFYMFLHLMSASMFSQQDPQYTQYRYNMNIVNPAYAGSRDALSLNILGKTQWLNIDGAPRTATLGIHSPLQKSNLGIGFSAIHETIGPLKESHMYGDVSYKLQVSLEGALFFGLKGGISFQNLDDSLLNFNEEQSIDSDFKNSTYANFGFGLYYKIHKFYAGFSMPNILKNSFFNSGLDTVSKLERINTVYVTSGYTFDINDNIQLKPSFLMKYATDIPLSFDVSSAAVIHDKLELGTSYRYKESIAFLTTFAVSKTFRLGYAYDHPLGSYANYSNGSHEIMLLFDFGVTSNKTAIK